MTDITRLLASLKRRSAHAKELGDDVTFVKLEDIDALVEELEELRAQIDRQEDFIREQDHLIGNLKSNLQASMQRTVTVKLPPKIERNDADGWFMYNGGRVGGGAAEWYNKALDDVISAQSTFVTVKLPEPYGYLRENDGQIQISIGAERPSDRSGGYATPWFAIYTAVDIKGAE
ncbi:TPA: hypothetical protein RFL89_001242 [Klebsiella aerogenes]|nr:hypothetical protein [Klebsiella aerogenes]